MTPTNTLNKKKWTFSEFMRFASDEEKQRVFTQVGHLANLDQQALVKAAQSK